MHSSTLAGLVPLLLASCPSLAAVITIPVDVPSKLPTISSITYFGAGCPSSSPASLITTTSAVSYNRALDSLRGGPTLEFPGFGAALAKASAAEASSGNSSVACTVQVKLKHLPANWQFRPALAHLSGRINAHLDGRVSVTVKSSFALLEGPAMVKANWEGTTVCHIPYSDTSTAVYERALTGVGFR